MKAVEAPREWKKRPRRGETSCGSPSAGGPAAVEAQRSGTPEGVNTTPRATRDQPGHLTAGEERRRHRISPAVGGGGKHQSIHNQATQLLAEKGRRWKPENERREQGNPIPLGGPGQIRRRHNRCREGGNRTPRRGRQTLLLRAADESQGRHHGTRLRQMPGVQEGDHEPGQPPHQRRHRLERRGHRGPRRRNVDSPGRSAAAPTPRHQATDAAERSDPGSGTSTATGKFQSGKKET